MFSNFLSCLEFSVIREKEDVSTARGMTLVMLSHVCSCEILRTKVSTPP